MNPYRIIISGGGTGGHVFPAIAIADTFRQRHPDVEILFVGADNRMEMERVPKAGYKIVGLPVSGFDRSHKLKNIAVMFRLFKSLRMAKKIIRTFKPDIAVGVGGYASAPTLRAASSLGVPTLIQEQNSYAGITNKLLGKRAAKICVAYEGMERFFPAAKIVLTGNPVRKELETGLEDKKTALEYFRLQPDRKTVLFIGGSLGARTINNGLLDGLPQLLDAGIQIIWQTGKYYHDIIRHKLERTDTKSLVWRADFISRMDYAYAAADLVVSRAGASSVSELCLLGKAAILIPSPNVAEDHQTKNALAVAGRDAAVVIADSDAEKLLADTVLNLIHDDGKLQSLSKNIAPLARRQSAELIVDEIEKIISSHHRDTENTKIIPECTS
ncbi:MAG: undecaprenyldiphospho-muramoylpentapeptide beta-N-acetylglucosaminyltransferase [Tannerella sp.]|jgi:UDP-N-acetylglucosamine--N-acetylmuramyl-(pentapeptide) pyrophosphoryl-undecaprenol N-acetylglucosamine transferase|nr:undecaprenyldiphospho-muramoylpentapeptide beta-N-acetylglucosaminyltransferase [Tannerella sp.]